MGCSNCGKEMCDCPPSSGNSMSQDYKGMPNYAGGSSSNSDRFIGNLEYSDKKHFAEMVERKDIDAIIKLERNIWDRRHHFSTPSGIDYVKYAFVRLEDRWGRKETMNIFIKNKQIMEKYFSSVESFVKFTKRI